MDRVFVRVENGRVAERMDASPGKPFHPGKMLWDDFSRLFPPSMDWRNVTHLNPRPDVGWKDNGDGSYTPPAVFSINGLQLILSAGFIKERPEFTTGGDTVSFGPPAQLQGIAVDLVAENGVVQFQPYTWLPLDDPPQGKGDLPVGLDLIQEDVIRGLLPAGSTSFDDLEAE